MTDFGANGLGRVITFYVQAKNDITDSDYASVQSVVAGRPASPVDTPVIARCYNGSNINITVAGVSDNGGS